MSSCRTLHITIFTMGNYFGSNSHDTNSDIVEPLSTVGCSDSVDERNDVYVFSSDDIKHSGSSSDDDGNTDIVYTPIKPEEPYFVEKFFRPPVDKISGKWLIFYPKDNALLLWDRLISDVNDEKIDIPCMKRSTDRDNSRASNSNYVIIIYTDGDIRKSTGLGNDLLKYIVGNYAQTYIYWKSEEQTRKGTAATGCVHNYERRIWVPKTIRKRTAKTTCDMCGGGTKNKVERAGLCTECYDPTIIRIKSGNYQGKLFTEVVSIPPKQRVYGRISSDDMKTLSRLDSGYCRKCFNVQSTKQVISDKWPYCLRCFQTGHVKYSSGKYTGTSAMLIGHQYKDYDGKDLSIDDKYLHTLSTQLNNELITNGKTMCTYGPCVGMRWKTIVNTPKFDSYRSDFNGRSCDLVVYCATLEHLSTEKDVDYRNF